MLEVRVPGAVQADAALMAGPAGRPGEAPPPAAGLTVPAEPQQEDAQQGERRVVTGHVDGVAGGVETADAGAQHPGGCQRGNAAHL